MNKAVAKSAESSNRILPGIQCFSWNASGSQIAVSPATKEIWIYESSGSPDITKWTQVAVLKEHFDIITALDWHPTTNLLLSASVDRGVYVWKPVKDSKTNEFEPQIGMIKEKIANICAKWSKNGEKYVVGSSSGFIYVGYYNPNNNFWVAYPINKKPSHKASVTSTCFDSLSGRVVVSGSLDGTVQITSVFQEEYDKNSTDGPFGTVSTFGDTLLSINSNGWINFVQFSPNCTQVAFGTHDCELNFSDVKAIGTKEKDSKAKAKTEKLMLKGNPLLSCEWLSEDKLVGAGFDKSPILYKKEGSSWKQTKILDQGITQVRPPKITGNAFMDKRVYFNADIKLGSNVEMKETNTKHVNYINCMKPFAQKDGIASILCTSDINGYLNYWDVAKE